MPDHIKATMNGPGKISTLLSILPDYLSPANFCGSKCSSVHVACRGSRTLGRSPAKKAACAYTQGGQLCMSLQVAEGLAYRSANLTASAGLQYTIKLMMLILLADYAEEMHAHTGPPGLHSALLSRYKLVVQADQIGTNHRNRHRLLKGK